MTEPQPRHPGVTFEAASHGTRPHSGAQYDTVRGRGKFDDGHPNDYPQERPEIQKSTSFDPAKRGQRGKRTQFNPRRADSQTSSSSERGYYAAGPDSAPAGAQGWGFRENNPTRHQSLRGSSRPGQSELDRRAGRGQGRGGGYSPRHPS